eukprot:1614949-Amphidinium_carterae.1
MKSVDLQPRSLCQDVSLMSGSIATAEDALSTAGGSVERDAVRRCYLEASRTSKTVHPTN